MRRFRAAMFGVVMSVISACMVVSCSAPPPQQQPGVTAAGADGAQTTSWATDPGAQPAAGTSAPQQGLVESARPSARPRTDARPAADALRAAPPGSLPSLEEEVWVVVRPEKSAKPQAADDDVPGTGAMICIPPIGDVAQHVPVPLKHTEVSTRIAAHIASVDVTQQFHNPFSTKIEAVYVFPLPENAAVNEFIMTIGERRIRGIIRDRVEAEIIYKQARDAGHNAALLTQERPNVFTQKVANIEPGKSIDVHVRYFHTLAYDDGWYEWVFPMVVGPRFNPPGPAPGGSDGIGAAPLGAHGTTGQKTEVQYLRPDQRSGHDIGLKVTLDAGVPIERLTCTSHDVVVREERQHAEITLASHDTVPNRDFVLRWKVAGDAIRSTFITHRDAMGQGYFSLVLYPPAELESLPRQDMDIVFVIDTSGSMRGRQLEQAEEAVIHALDQLEEGDCFQIVNFSNVATYGLGGGMLAANDTNVSRAREYVRGLEARGGTMMVTGLRAAFDQDWRGTVPRHIVFLTDGFIGNEAEVLNAVRSGVGGTRIFSFGIGSSPNRYLMSRMAKLGRGAVAYLSLDDEPRDVMDRFFTRVSHPALSGLSIDWGGLKVSEVSPDNMAKSYDLFVGRALTLTGKVDAKFDEAGAVRVTGWAGEERVRFDVPLPETRLTHPALPAVWARQRIAEIYDRAAWDDYGDPTGQIRQIALRHDLVSAYTAFIAVDGARRTEGSFGTTVPVGVPVPKGVQYETTVREN